MEHISVTAATYISTNIVICRAPSRKTLPATRKLQANFIDPNGDTTSPWWEQVDVNTKKHDSFVLKLQSNKEYASAAYHRSFMILENVTVEAWVKTGRVVDGASPIWFGLTDGNLIGRFLYGIFLRKRVVNGVGNGSAYDVSDVEIGHTEASMGPSYGGSYNYTWPMTPSPMNLTVTFPVGLMVNRWHHIAAVRDVDARTWKLFINGSKVGNWSYASISNISSIKETAQRFAEKRYETTRYKEQLVGFFKEYDPYQRWHVEAFMQKWKGREHAMFDYLYLKYPNAANHLKAGFKGRLPGNLVRQDATLETTDGLMKDDPANEAVWEGLNSGGTDPRTRTSPFPCDKRIHGLNVSVCLLPWGATGHHTIPNLFVGRGIFKYQTHNGRLDDVRLWNVARSEREIREHFDVELGGSEDGLVSYYNFNEASGVMAYDVSAKGSNADTNRNNLHLLGNPKEMWAYDDVLSAFTDSVNYCPHCSVMYTPSPEIRNLDQDYEPVPTNFGISPSNGPLHGGTVVTVSGRGFVDSDLLSCRFQGAVSNQGGQTQGIGLVMGTFVSPQEMLCTSPAHHIIGPTYFFVSNDGEQFSNHPAMFTYSTVIPALHEVYVEPGPLTGHPATYCPIRTPLTGGTTVTIRGENFMQSDATKQLQFRMGEMPALPVHRFINSTHIVIKTPPYHTRFNGDLNFGGSETNAHVLPQSYAYPSPYPKREMRVQGFRPGISYAKNNFDMDPAFPLWGQGKPFDCSRDEPGQTCYRPAFTVRVTNDGGRTWSDFPPYNTTRTSLGFLQNRTNCILYSDLVISPEGDDEVGDGTLTRPFRSLMKAATWAHGEGDRILMFRGTSLLFPRSLQPK